MKKNKENIWIQRFLATQGTQRLITYYHLSKFIWYAYKFYIYTVDTEDSRPVCLRAPDEFKFNIQSPQCSVSLYDNSWEKAADALAAES